MGEKHKSPEVEEQAELILLAHGQHIASQVLDGLAADGRFVRLAGRWFLDELALPPTEDQLAALAWAMVPLEKPQSTRDLLPLVQPPLAQGDHGLFGLYLAMHNYPAIFESADPGDHPRWVLSGPPPGSCTPQHAAYDPETYEMLCLPGEPTSAETVTRLWDLGLLRAIL